MNHLFTYGSLMCPDILHRVTGYSKSGISARLDNYTRRALSDREYPGVRVQRESSVTGTLYFDLSLKAIELLDIFEGELYRRELVEVETESGNKVEAMVYVIKDRYSYLLTKRDWCFDHFLTVGKTAFEDSYEGFGEPGSGDKQEDE